MRRWMTPLYAKKTYEDDCEAWLKRIEREISTAPNRVRDAMNGAVTAIVLHCEFLEALAVGTARRIGPVEIDLGDTGCKTPDAVAYIAKTKAYREKQERRAAARTANRTRRCCLDVLCHRFHSGTRQRLKLVPLCRF